MHKKKKLIAWLFSKYFTDLPKITLIKRFFFLNHFTTAKELQFSYKINLLSSDRNDFQWRDLEVAIAPLTTLNKTLGFKTIILQPLKNFIS